MQQRGQTREEDGSDSIHPSWLAILTDPARLAILRALCTLGTATIADLSSRCHTSEATVRRHLDALETLDLVGAEATERDGMTPGRPARRFTLDTDAATQIRALLDLLSVPLGPTAAPAPPPPLAPRTAP